MLKKGFILLLIFSSNLFCYEISDVSLDIKTSISDMKYHNGSIYIVHRQFGNIQMFFTKFDGEKSTNLINEENTNDNIDEFEFGYPSKFHFGNNDIWISGKNKFYQLIDNQWHIHRYTDSKYKEIDFGNFIYTKNNEIYGFAITKKTSNTLFYKYSNNNFEILLEGRFGEFIRSNWSSIFIEKDDYIIFPKNLFGKEDTFNDPVLDSNNIIFYDGEKYSGYPLIVSDYSEWSKIVNFMKLNNNGDIVIGTSSIYLSNDSLEIYENYGSGLSEMNSNGEFFVYDTTTGLPYNYNLGCYEDLYDIAIDDEGNYWCTASGPNLLIVTPKQQVVNADWSLILDNSVFYKNKATVPDSSITERLDRLKSGNPINTGFKHIEIDEEGNLYIMFNFGLLKYTPVETSVMIDMADDFNLYPNPVINNHHLTISSKKNLIESVKLYDSNGKLLFTNDYNQENLINIKFPDNIKTGVYFVVIQSDNILTTRKIMYNK